MKFLNIKVDTNKEFNSICYESKHKLEFLPKPYKIKRSFKGEEDITIIKKVNY